MFEVLTLSSTAISALESMFVYGGWGAIRAAEKPRTHQVMADMAGADPEVVP